MATDLEKTHTVHDVNRSFRENILHFNAAFNDPRKSSENRLNAFKKAFTFGLESKSSKDLQSPLDSVKKGLIKNDACSMQAAEFLVEACNKDILTNASMKKKLIPLRQMAFVISYYKSECIIDEKQDHTTAIARADNALSILETIQPRAVRKGNAQANIAFTQTNFASPEKSRNNFLSGLLANVR